MTQQLIIAGVYSLQELPAYQGDLQWTQQQGTFQEGKHILVFSWVWMQL